MTIQGIQTWNFSNATSATTTITGVAYGLGGPGPNGLPNNPGVQQINFQYSGSGGAQTLTVGSMGAGGGIQSLLTGTAAMPAIVVRNNLGDSTVNVFVGANQWTGVANSTLVVATNSGDTAFDVGPDVATAGAGYVNWVVQDWTPPPPPILSPWVPKVTPMGWPVHSRSQAPMAVLNWQM